VIPFFLFVPVVRRIIYTMNAIEALNAKLRPAVLTRGHFPIDEAATKLIYLLLRQLTGEWKMPPREWRGVIAKFHPQTAGLDPGKPLWLSRRSATADPRRWP
jgi:putative transposase